MSAPRNLELNLGKLCNNRCVFCLDGRAPAESRRWVPLDRALGELRAARRDGARALGLLGGEPTAHPQIVELVEAARELGFARISVSTNALKLADRAFADRLVDAGVTRFSVSIHDHRADVEDALTGRSGNFDTKLAALGHLRELRRQGRLPDNVSINPVIHSHNVDQLAQLVAFFAERGLRDQRFNLIRTDACPDRGPELTPRLDPITRAVTGTVALALRSRGAIQVSFGDLPLCAYPWEVLSEPRLARQVVGEARDLDTWVSVFMAPLDREREASRFHWVDRKRDALKIQPDDPCGDCKLRQACEGIWRSYVQVHGCGDLTAQRAVPRWR
jgi:MoaA/NifB/PqqE/SkfB family radical SAM enzyme